MQKQNNDVSVQLMIFGCFAIYLTNLHVIPLDIMEARNFITAREMLTDGSWFHTTLNGIPRYEKPPLPTWITAVFGSIFGLKVWALRLPAALMSIISFHFLLRLASSIHKNSEVAKISVFVAATSFYILFSGKNGQWDIYTHGFAIIGLYYLSKALNHEIKNLKYAIVSGVLFGCSILSKGPVAMYAMVLPFFLAYLIVYRKSTPKANWKYLAITTLTSIVVGSSWYVGVYLFNPEKVMAAMSKESGNWTSYNVRPFYYYWSFFIQTGIWSLTALLAILIPLVKKFQWERPKDKFSYLWTVFSLILLSLIPEKKSRYLLPVLFPLAITTALSIYNMFVLRDNRSLWNRINIAVYKFIPFFLSIAMFFGSIYLLVVNKWSWSGIYLILLMCISLVLFRVLQKDSFKIQSSLYANMIFCIAIVWFGLPYIYQNFTNPSYKSTYAIHSYENRLGLSTYAMSNPTPEFVWEYGSKIKIWNIEANSTKEDLGMLVSNSDLELFLNTFADREVELLTRFDMNLSAEGSKSHRERLYIDYYLVKGISD